MIFLLSEFQEREKKEIGFRILPFSHLWEKRREEKNRREMKFFRDISTGITKLFSSNHVAFPRLAAKPIRSFPLLINSSPISLVTVGFRSY